MKPEVFYSFDHWVYRFTDANGYEVLGGRCDLHKNAVRACIEAYRRAYPNWCRENGVRTYRQAAELLGLV